MTPRPPLFPAIRDDRALWHATTGPLPIVYQTGYCCDAATSRAVRYALLDWPYAAEPSLGVLTKVGTPTFANKEAQRLAELIPRAKNDTTPRLAGPARPRRPPRRRRK